MEDLYANRRGKKMLWLKLTRIGVTGIQIGCICIMSMLIVTSVLADFQEASPESGETPLMSSRKYRVVTEPISSDTLKDLETRFAGEKNRGVKINVAAILYRYNRPVGKEFLHSAARNGDMLAISTLALNQEDEFRGIILKAYTDIVNNNAIVDEEMQTYIPWYFVLSLGRWPDVEVKQTLLDSYKLDSHQGYLPLALAKQGILEAVPWLQRTYKQLRKSKEDSPEYKICLAETEVALCVLKAPESGTIAPVIVSDIKSSRTPLSRALILIDAAGYLREPLLLDAVATRLETALVATRAGDTTEVEKKALVTLVQRCSLALGQSGDSKYVNVLKQAFDLDGGKLGDFRNRLAEVLIFSEAKEFVALVRTQMGGEWVNNHVSLSKLKKVPERVFKVPVSK